MDCDKWEYVLIQWINCLKLTEPINDLESLRNGEFFAKLLGILEPKHVSASNEECFITSLDLIKAQYPNYTFDGQLAADLQSLSIKNIKTLCSLLLHFACVVERKDSLIVPSCNKLPPDVQMYIKNFLEKVNSRITNFHFKKIIEEMNESNLSTTSYQWQPIGDSPLTGNSPLQEFLRSPVTKATKLQKDREIKKLRSELELERFEKADLQEELKEHKEQIAKLGNQVKEKSNQISKLRSELYALENKTPPHNNKHATFDIERHLKIEIQNLEQYVEQLQTKHDDLQGENIDISEKLRNSTKELKIWQTTAQTLELNNKELSEKYIKQEEELQNLKVQCSELSAILAEIRSNNEGNDSSLFFSPAKSKRRSMNDNALFEDLAHTIVDVQLKDAQKENVELKNLLKESADKGNAFQTELANMKECYEETCKNLKDLENERNYLMQKVEELNDSYKTLEDLKNQTQEQIKLLTASHVEKDSLISSLQCDLQASNALCNNYVSQNKNLTSELEQIKSELSKNQTWITEKDALYESVRKEADLLQIKYDETVDKSNSTNFVLEQLKKRYDEYTEKMEKSLMKLENIVYGHNEMKLDENFLDNVIIRLQSDKTNTAKEIAELKHSVSDFEDLVVILRKEINELRNVERLNAEEREGLRKLLNITETSMEKVKLTIEEQNIEIKDKTDKIIELNSAIEELKKLEQVIANKNSEISNLELNIKEKVAKIDSYVVKTANFKQKLQEMEHTHATLTKDLSNKTQLVNDFQNNNLILNRQVQDLHSQVNNLTSKHAQELMDQEKTYLEKIHNYNLQIQEYSTKVEQIQTDLDLITKELELKSAECIDLQNAKKIMEENNVKVTEDLQRKIEITQDTIKKLEIELSIVIGERDTLKQDVNNLSSDRINIISEKESLTNDLQHLKLQLKSSLEKLSNVEEECSQKDTIISQNGKELLNMKLDIESKKQEYKKLQGSIEKLNTEASSYKFCIQTLESKNTDFQNKIEKLEKELKVLNALKDSLEAKNSEIGRQMHDVLAKVANKDEEINELIKQMNHQKKHYEENLKIYEKRLGESVKNIEYLENEKSITRNDNNKEISLLKSEINTLNDKIYELNAKEIDYIHELQVIKSELNVAFEKYTHSFDELQELKSEYETQTKDLTENLHEVVAKYNQLERNHQSSIHELETVNNRVDILSQEKIALEIKIIEQKKKYDQEIEETNEQFNTDFKQLKAKESHLEQSLLKAESDLQQQKGIQFRLENDVKRLIGKLNDIEVEKGELLTKISSLEIINGKLEKDYNSLSLCHEEYILESESKLKLREEQFQNEINNIEMKKKDLEGEVKDLLEQISALRYENSICQKLLEENEQRYQEQLNELRSKIEEYKLTNIRIVEEQNSLQEKMLNYKNQSEEQFETISKLKSAYDILQTGKERLEVDLKNLQEFQANLEREQVIKETEAKAILVANQEKMKILSEELEAHRALARTKDAELVHLNEKLTDLQRVNATLKMEIESVEVQMKKSDEDHEITLNKIEEENIQAINEMSNEFKELKTKYEEISEELTYLHNERNEIRKSVENQTDQISELQKNIENKQALIEELQKDIEQTNEAQRQKETAVKDLSDELADTINKLALVKNEKLKLDVNLQEARTEIDRLKKSRDDILEAQHKIIKETEDNILRVHANAIDVKNDLLSDIENAREEVRVERNEKLKLQTLLEEEKAGVKFLEIELLNAKNEKSKFQQVYFALKQNLDRLNEILELKDPTFVDPEEIDEEMLRKITANLERNIAETYKRSRDLTNTITKLENFASENRIKLAELEKDKEKLNEEKEELLSAYNDLINQNQFILQEHTKEKEEMQEDISHWINKFEEKSSASNDLDALKTENEVLHQTVISLKDQNMKAYNVYNDFASNAKSFKTVIDKILKDRNSLETLIFELRQSLINIQTKYVQLNRESLSKHQEQKESFECIVDDIQKQFNRYSKIAYNLAYNNVQISEKVVQGILSEKYVDWEPLLKDLNIEEVSEKLEELTDRSADALEQLKSFGEVLDKNEIKNTKVLKENILKTGSSSQLADLKKEEEWRKKYNALRQKLTLTENVKNNYEKKVRQLREENKKLSSSELRTVDEDASYKILLQQHIQAKEDFEKKVSELRAKYQKLQAECAELKKQKVKSEEDPSIDKNLREAQAIKEAYGKLMADNTKLELNNATLRKVIEDKNSELVELSLVREAYEKLLEENSKMMTEVDTLKYKRSRDKEEFLHMLKKDREDREARENKNIQQVRMEYEKKLESMKAKMLNLYKEEIDREARKLIAEKNSSDLLRLELEESKRAIEQLKVSQKINPFGSLESLSALSVKSECDPRDIRAVRSRNNLETRSGTVLPSGRNTIHDRRYATLPRNMGTIEENNKASINAVPPDLGRNLEMEDEDELFNNKYLADLKEGNCVVGGTIGDSRSSRVSELMWRNSLCPPHLKSSYPAELQFASPSRFKEDDIKTGNIDFDDSMSTKLLPGEKSRTKKDIGTTSYKKPGPPTPSKNGGRLSLQSNEIQFPRDLPQELDGKTPKRTTPGRIKAFFLGLNSNTKTGLESQASTPKPKSGTRLFRKPR